MDMNGGLFLELAGGGIPRQILGAFTHIFCAPPNSPLPTEHRGQLVERLLRNRELLSDTLE